MGLMDNIKDAFGGDKNDAIDKAKDLANQNEARIDQAVDQAGDFVDDKTGGKFESQVDQGQDFIKDKTGNL